MPMHEFLIPRMGVCPHCAGTGKKKDSPALGAQLRARRKASGISMRQLAMMLDCSRAWLSALECGKSAISDDWLRWYLTALRVRRGGR